MQEIKEETGNWMDKKSASKKDLQRLVGKLNFAVGTVRAGRLFFSRILQFMHATPKHGIRRLGPEVQKDIKWWNTFLQEFDGILMMPEIKWRSPEKFLSTDSCLTGIGGYCEGEYFHTEIPAQLQNLKGVHINEYECLAIMVALKIWAAKCRGLKILAYCDNEVMVNVVNSG